MVKVSIATLIYKSNKYADWIYESVHKYTPMLTKGDAEFFFVANDPSPEVLHHLREKNYPFIINENPKRSSDELFKLGFGAPEYIGRVYRGYNKAILSAKYEIVVLLNSDNCLSPDWLENLLKYLSLSTVVTSQLVERYHPIHGVFPGAYFGDFGKNPSCFNEDLFLKFVENKKTTGLITGITYMPCAFYKDNAIKVNLYPEGNVAGKSFFNIIEYGDQFFFRKLREAGISHFTSLDSIVYHFKEGEMDEEKSLDRREKGTINYPQPDYYPLKPIILKTEDKIGFLALDNEALFKKKIKKILAKIINNFSG